MSLPLQSRLYKILEIHKEGFSAKLLDIIDGSKKEVLCSRLSNLSLEVLSEYNFSSPTFYHNLQRLTDSFRNKYEGPTHRGRNLRLLNPTQGDREVTQPGDVPPTFTDDPATQEHSNTGSVPSEHVHTGYDNNITEDVHDGINDRGHVTTSDVHEGVHGNHDYITEKENHFTSPPDGLEQRDIETIQDVPLGLPERMGTRFKGLKHVPVFGSQIDKKLNIGPISILKFSSYKILDNFKVESMRIINKNQFTARKKALIVHSDLCHENLCSICQYYGAVKNFRYDSGNFARYIQPSFTPQPPSGIRKPKKTVHFAPKTLFCSNSEFTSLPLDINLLHRACFFNTSFKELGLLSRNQ